jgi:CRP-like cAMP-binding protein
MRAVLAVRSNHLHITMSSRGQSKSAQGGARCDFCSTHPRCIVSRLPAEQRAALQSRIVERAVPVGRELEVQGAQTDTVKIIKLGLFKGIRLTSRGDGQPVCLQGKGQLVGLSSLHRQPAPLSIVAITPARVCELPVELVADLGSSDRNFSRGLCLGITRFVNNLADWSRIPREDGVANQLFQALQLISLEEGSDAFRIPSHVELGRVLGARRETIARHLGALIEQGRFVKIDRWHGMLARESGQACT